MTSERNHSIRMPRVPEAGKTAARAAAPQTAGGRRVADVGAPGDARVWRPNDGDGRHHPARRASSQYQASQTLEAPPVRGQRSPNAPVPTDTVKRRPLAGFLPYKK